MFFFSGCHFNKELIKFDTNDLWQSQKNDDTFFLRSFNALVGTCKLLLDNNKTKITYKNICKKASDYEYMSNKEALQFFIENFKLNLRKNLAIKGLMTGYYEPEVIAYENYKHGSFPIFKIDVEKYGRAVFNSSRKKINKGILKDKELEIAWVNNEIEAFFLHIQGSGRLRYKDGKIKKIRYAGSNNKEYTAIGKILIELGKIQKDKVSMFSIKEWLYKNKIQAKKIMEKNERYIYFEEYIGRIKGSAKIELVPFISIAVDPKHYSVGDILLIKENNNLKKIYITIAHDTGAAIKGNQRIDLFTGYGNAAEKAAATMKKDVLIWKLEPKNK
ncbi:MAG: hypothetical protein CMP36_04540 [Rickettsiales bacterium]|nr:hypothetical protein [Rickettsiales bacterium]OUV76165.1 MAG: hypothetical protein CBC91_06630 [Rickettsiales bacterium TMED131]